MTERREPGDRSGRRAFFSDPEAESEGVHEVAEPVVTGRQALFSSVGDKPVEKHRAVRVECRTCLVDAPVPLGSVLFSLIPSVWVPTRPWPRLMTCPHCGRRSWCRVHWRGGH